MKTRLLVILFALVLVAPPVLADTLATAGGTWQPWAAPTGTGGPPFWDTRSWDGAACNVGFWVTNTAGCGAANFYQNTPNYNAPASTEYFLGSGAATFTVQADGSSALSGIVAGSGISSLVDSTVFGWFNTNNRDETHPMLVGGVPYVGFAVPSGDYGFYAHVISNQYPTGQVTYYSDRTYGDNRSQFALFNLGIAPNGDQRYAFGFEDLTGPSDYDYNDVMGIISYSPVPEPGSLMLMGVGLVGGAAMLRRRRRAGL